MKKLCTVVFFLTAALAFGKGNSEPDYHYEDFEWETNGNAGIKITGYTGKGGAVNIPPTINGMQVTSIDGQVFRDKQLTSVTIPDSVTSIGFFAFFGNLLISVTIPDSVTGIEWGAFAENLNLTAINVSSGNPHYASIDGVLYDKDFTTLMQYPSGKTGPVSIPNGVTGIGGFAFVGSRLTGITIPDSVILISEVVFSDNLLTSVIIPDNVFYIGEGSFQRNQLTNVIIPDSVTYIGAGAFRQNQLTNVIIPGSVNSIWEQAFADNQLTGIIIPNSVTHIRDGAFLGNPLTSITIGANVTFVEAWQDDGNGPFDNGFEEAYSNNGKQAGTYTRPNTESTTWTRR